MAHTMALRYLKKRSTRIVCLLAVPILLLAIIRHVYLSSPQFAFRQWRQAMDNGDAAEMAQYMTPEYASEYSQILARAHGPSSKQSLQQEMENLDQFIAATGAQWVYTGNTHAIAKVRTPFGVIRQSGTTNLSQRLSQCFSFIKTPQRWVMNDAKGCL